MNFFGVGVMELAIIFLVAFLVMGPLKTIEMARSAGKLIGDLRRTVNDITAAADLSGLDPTRPDSAAASRTDAPRPPEPPPAGAVPTTGIVADPDDSPPGSLESSPGGSPESSPGGGSGDISGESSGKSPGESDEQRS